MNLNANAMVFSKPFPSNEFCTLVIKSYFSVVGGKKSLYLQLERNQYFFNTYEILPRQDLVINYVVPGLVFVSSHGNLCCRR